MGWLYGWHSREDLIKHLVDEPISYRTIAHRATYEDHQAILWAVHEFPVDCEVEQYRGKRFIACYLMGYDRRDSTHGYKDMEESMGPFFYSCPLIFLVHAPEVANQAWRDGVAKFHAEKSVKRLKMKAIKIGETVKLKEGCKPPEIRVTSLKPLRGVHEGVLYRITERFLALA
jgi:hypothetical protein